MALADAASSWGQEIFFAAFSIAIACLEARFFIKASETRERIWLYAAYSFLFFGSILLVNQIESRLPFSPSRYVLAAYVAQFLSRFAFGFFLLRMPWSHAATASMIMIALTIMQESLFAYTLFFFTIMWKKLIGMVPPEILPLIFASSVKFMICAVVLRTVLRNYWPSHDAYASRYMHKYMYVVLLPFTLLIAALERNMDMSVEEVGPLYVVVTGHTLPLWTIVIVFLSFGVFFAALATYRRMCDLLRTEGEKAALYEQVNAQKKYVLEARQRYEAYGSFRHDLGNHLLTLGGLIKTGERAKALGYLQEIGSIVGGLSFPVNSGNPAIDVLLSEKLTYAKSAGIAVSHCIAVKEWDGVRDLDACVVLANLLDNAIAACMSKVTSEPFIEVNVRKKDAFFMFSVRNGRGRYGKIKEGTGLRNVRMTAEKYGGTIDIESGEDDISVCVLFCANTVS